MGDPAGNHHPAGKVGIVVSKVGSDLPEGEFLAAAGQKGIWRQVLGPGRYRLNPYGYRIDLIDAISIPSGTSAWSRACPGARPRRASSPAPGTRGCARTCCQPGLYYVNPKELRVDVLEIG